MRTYRQPIQIIAKEDKVEIVPTYDKYKGNKIVEGEKYG